MTFEEFFTKTSGITDENEIKKLLKSLSEKQIKCFFEDVKEYYLSKQGEKMLLALEIEKILFNTPQEQMKWREFEEILILYQKLIKEQSYKTIRSFIKIEEETTRGINNLYDKKFEKSILNYFKWLEDCIEQPLEQNSLREIIPKIIIENGHKIGVTSSKGNEDDKKINNFTRCVVQFIVLKKPLLKTLDDPISYNDFFISDTDKRLLESSVKMFKKENYVASLSLIVPRIESILREIIKIKGGTELTVKSFREKKYFEHKTFDACIKSLEIKELFSEKMILLLKAIFSSKYGFNIRNKLAHGLLDKNEYTETANIVVLIIFLYIGSCKF